MLITLAANNSCLGCYPPGAPIFSERPGVWATSFIVGGAWILLLLGMFILGSRSVSRDGPVTSDGSSATDTSPDRSLRLATVVLGVGGGASVVAGFLILLLS